MMKKRRQKIAATPIGAQSEATGWRAVLREPLALGLAALTFLRPWLDGITFPTDNFYFVWGIFLLFAIWAVRMLVKGEPMRFGWPTLLLGAFWAIVAATSLDSIQFDSSYRGIILWTSYFCLFVLAVNGIRTRTAITIVLGAFALTALAESVWGLIHYKFILPDVREKIMHNPRLSKMYFGTTQPGPELIHRLQVNRAFGSLLFPNALAAFLVLAIPFALGEGARSVVLLTRGLRASGASKDKRGKGANAAPPQTPPSGLAVMLTGACAWLATTSISFFIVTFVASFQAMAPGMERFGPFLFAPDGAWRLAEGGYVMQWALFVVALPVLIGVGAAYVLRRYGTRIFSLAMRVWLLPPLLIMALGSLYFTFSRGGILALAGALAMTAALLAWGRIKGAKTARTMTRACIALAVAALAVGASAQPAAETAPEAVPTQSGNAQAAQAPPLVGGGAITKKGKNLTAKDLMNPASLSLRATYWQTGLKMALDNFWTGVGVGNFGVAYPKYQGLKAGDTKAAHNDYLQAWCETGIFGALLFAAFWAYFVIWGARRILQEEDRLERWGLAGLYCGLLAFTAHSMVDFNFFNPALAYFAFLLAGIFYARALLKDETVQEAPGCAGPPAGPTSIKGAKRRQLLAIPMLVVVALVSGMTFRVYLSDFIVGNRKFLSVGNHHNLNAMYEAGQYVYHKVQPGDIKKRRFPVVGIATMARLVPDRSVLSSVGSIRVLSPGSRAGSRALRPEEPIPNNAVYVATKPYRARWATRDYVESWLQECKYADAIFPHNPELAAYLLQWYELMATRVIDKELKLKYAVECVRWAEAAVKRSPEFFLYHERLARALWLRGNLDQGSDRSDDFERALREYRKAADLYPTSSRSWRMYAKALEKYGKALDESGVGDKGAALVADAKAAEERANELQEIVGDR
ncbi:MAG: hypothetical protein GWP08_07400 [Nitrospiraceae bacterium]|nr:hypothetical protein [Nitrospiraceae bacterium]